MVRYDRCGCGRLKYRTSARCCRCAKSADERRASRVTSHRGAAAPLADDPERLGRIARYAARAALKLPLFTRV